MQEPLFSIVSVRKEFPGVIALEDVSLNLYRGEVHVLVGENGAGKSTLMKILAGIYQPTSGELIFENKNVHFQNVKDAERQGIAIIHQELNLCDDLSVAENIFLSREFQRFLMMDRKLGQEMAQELLDSLSPSLNPATKVRNLNVSQKQLVEIAKAISIDAQVIIMDEPTSSIGEHEVDQLFYIIEKLKAANKSIVYISHKLDELDRIADRVTVLRDGAFIFSDLYSNLTIDQIITGMVGRELTDFYPRVECPRGEKILSVKGLSLKRKFEDVSFDLYQGEILGFAGLIGSGRTEIAQSIIGHIPTREGEVEVHGEALKNKNVISTIKQGVVYLPEDRKRDGLFLGHTVKFNIVISSLRDFIINRILTVVKSKKVRKISEEMIAKLRIKTPSYNQKILYLSGGNQQKVILAKSLLLNPRVLILDEPTRGIDINSKAEIYNILNDLKKQGVGIIIISSELPEIIGVSDRVIVVKEGQVTANLSGSKINQQDIMRFAAI